MGNRIRNILEVLGVSAKLGLTSFGGPVAHLGYFHEEYVRRKKWMDERSYADLVALCQFLPGPASSQVGIGIGIVRAGWLGGIAAWLGFTLPSVIALILFALFVQGGNIGDMTWIHGLKIVAVAVVAHAVIGMGKQLASDRSRQSIAVATACMALLWPSAITQVLLIVLAGLIGMWLYRGVSESDGLYLNVPVSRFAGMVSLISFAALLLILPLLRLINTSGNLALFDSFYRAGSLVFGGGHVVLPLLEQEVVPNGWIQHGDFLAGYGAAQAVPGPLFTFASYLGTMINGLSGALIASAAIFLPAFLLVFGALPFWNSWRQNPNMKGVLMGVNAAVVGILLAALYDPIWTSSIRSTEDFVLAAVLFAMLAFWKCPPWLVVVTGAIGGIILTCI